MKELEALSFTEDGWIWAGVGGPTGGLLPPGLVVGALSMVSTSGIHSTTKEVGVHRHCTVFVLWIC